jgi:hypothetical protein
MPGGITKKGFELLPYFLETFLCSDIPSKSMNCVIGATGKQATLHWHLLFAKSVVTPPEFVYVDTAIVSANLRHRNLSQRHYITVLII